jgi:hypothetical protein
MRISLTPDIVVRQECGFEIQLQDRRVIAVYPAVPNPTLRDC